MARMVDTVCIRDVLSPREIEVLQRLAEGKTNKEIGCALKISENTVEFHMKNLFRKLNMSTRTQVLAKAMRNGWT